MTSPMPVLAECASLFGFGGVVVDRVDFAGTSVSVVIEVVEREHHRRQEADLSALEDRDLWEALANLPSDMPLQWAALDPVQAALLDVAPKGVIESIDDAVVRVIRPAVRITGVMKLAKSWRGGLEDVSRFSAQSPRGIILVNKRVPPTAAQRARTLGVGLVVSIDGRLEAIVPPGPTVARVGPRSFRFYEAVYGAWLKRSRPRTAPMP